MAIKLEVCSSKSSLLQSEYFMYKKMGAVVTTPSGSRRAKGQTPPVSKCQGSHMKLIVILIIKIIIIIMSYLT